MHLTIGALRVLEESNNIYLRTEKHPTVDFIRSRNIKFKHMIMFMIA